MEPARAPLYRSGRTADYADAAGPERPRSTGAEPHDACVARGGDGSVREHPLRGVERGVPHGLGANAMARQLPRDLGAPRRLRVRRGGRVLERGLQEPGARHAGWL